MASRQEAGWLPFERLMECTHCGLCLPFCPTYRELGVEMDSPRGRIYLVRALEEERVQVTERLALHLDLCVGCRACETACPSGVEFGQILEHGRFLLGKEHGGSSPVLDLLYSRVLPKKSRIVGLGRLLALYRQSPLRSLTPALGRRGLLPEGLLKALDLMTVLPSEPEEMLSEFHPAIGDSRLKAAFLVCCMMRVFLTDVNRSTIRVLNRNGCDVVIPPDQECCGALHAHAGRLDEARHLAMLNIAAFEASGADVVVTNSAGCGAHMKEYANLFRGDGDWEERAHRFSEKVRDISELLSSLNPEDGMRPLPLKVAYDDPCHLVHGQGIREEPRNVLRRIPGLELVDLKEADWCCGSAGTYMLTQRDMALRLLRRKLEDIRASGVHIVATGNPGCLLWLAWGLKKEGIPASCMHPVQILDMAYG
jgi:glycolate oxidase iron-sulfur subunit